MRQASRSLRPTKIDGSHHFPPPWSVKVIGRLLCRCKIADAFLLQVTPDLPNPTGYEADRHRDRDCENHLQ